jgi:hypothetical protein
MFKNLTYSYPFIPEQGMLSFDLEGNPVVDDPQNNDLLTDISYQTVAKLTGSICSGNVEKFKQLYTEEYIANPDIYDFFKFEDNPPYWEYNSYSLCTCKNRNNEPDRIHKYMYVRSCNCSGGKRYLAYLTAHYSTEPGLYFDTNSSNSEKNASITPIQHFLLNDGPIDLTYKQMHCTFKKVIFKNKI